MKKIRTILLCFLAVFLAIPVMVTKAAENYDVIFRAGGRGVLNGGDGKKVVYSVPYGERVPEAPGVEPEAGYFFKGWNESIKSGDVVTEKKIYIAKYLPLVNGLEYSVKYVDVNGNQLATPKMAMGEKDSQLTEEAIAIEGYTADASEKTITLQTGSTELIFTYTAISADTPATEPDTEPGTEPETQPETQPQTNTPATQPPADNANDGINTPADPGANNTPNENEDNNQNSIPDEQETVDIEDDQVPLGDTPNETERLETENISDGEVPLAQKPDMNKSDNLMFYIALSVLGILAVGAGLRYVFIRKRRKS